MLIKEILPHLTFLLCAMGHCKSREFRALAGKPLYFLFIILFERLQFEKKFVILDCSLKLSTCNTASSLLGPQNTSFFLSSILLNKKNGSFVERDIKPTHKGNSKAFFIPSNANFQKHSEQ